MGSGLPGVTQGSEGWTVSRKEPAELLMGTLASIALLVQLRAAPPFPPAQSQWLWLLGLGWPHQLFPVTTTTNLWHSELPHTSRFWNQRDLGYCGPGMALMHECMCVCVHPFSNLAPYFESGSWT